MAIKLFYSPFFFPLPLLIFASFLGNPIDKTMNDKLMYIPNDNIQNYSFCILDYWFKSLEPTNQN